MTDIRGHVADGFDEIVEVFEQNFELHDEVGAGFSVYLEGEEVGYAELARVDGDVEIASFGLLPGFAGRGMGGALLATVTEAAWEDGAERVWLHTCSLDSPAALPAYEARGFRRYEERTGR